MREFETNSERFVRVRNKLGLTQPALAKLIGCAGNYVYLIEAGKKEPSEKLVSKLDQLEKSGIQDCGEKKTYETDRSEMLIEEDQTRYKVRRLIWKEADNDKLGELLREYANENGWGEVKEIATELLNRKITNKLKGKTP